MRLTSVDGKAGIEDFYNVIDGYSRSYVNNTQIAIVMIEHEPTVPMNEILAEEFGE
jgi:hypothetical protein